jgi:hypothetical protein
MPTIPRSILGLVAVLMLFVIGCPGQSTVPRDGAVYPDTRFTWPDTQPQVPDAPLVPDLPKPPDLYRPADHWPWGPDSYQGTPFGCLQDSDCFGLVCCPMPWGVKMCVETCQPPP